jgi:ABC-2 type transport system ATP-binding protein
MFGLIGPDGAGKTTLIRVMAGLLAPTSGRVRVLGRDPLREHRAITERVGYLSQRFSLYGDLSIDENITFFAEIHGLRRYDERRERLLELTQLGPFRSRLADQLSGGMKQKLALACTLVHRPDLILLDEPTTGVDPVSRREFWKLLSEFLAEGLTIVMATPYLDEAERCSRVALLHEGRLLALDDPTRLRAEYPAEVFEVLGHPPDRLGAVVAALPEIDDARRLANECTFDCTAVTAMPREHGWPTPSRAAGCNTSRCGRFCRRSRMCSSSGSARRRPKPAL